MQTPDVTKNQIIALLTTILTVLSSLGMPLSEANTNRVLVAGIGFSAVLTVSDAIIRFGRALMQGKKYENSPIGLDD